MDVFSDGNLIARLLLTLAAFGYGVGPMKADFNKTHARNPQWTAHARFHVVWQVLSYTGVMLLALALIWLPGPQAVARLYFAAALAFVMFGSFFIALVARPIYRGSLYDKNGYQPFRPPFGPRRWRWDVNTTAFSVFTSILVAATYLVR